MERRRLWTLNSFKNLLGCLFFNKRKIEKKFLYPRSKTNNRELSFKNVYVVTYFVIVVWCGELFLMLEMKFMRKRFLFICDIHCCSIPSVISMTRKKFKEIKEEFFSIELDGKCWKRSRSPFLSIIHFPTPCSNFFCSRCNVNFCPT